MADIKTKDSNKGTIKALDKAAIATQRMKQSYIAARIRRSIPSMPIRTLRRNTLPIKWKAVLMR